VGLATDASLDDTIVAWALAAVGGDHLTGMTGLGQGGPPWLMRYEASGWAGSAVVRAGAPETAGTQKFEVRGMALARAGGVPAPAVIAARADDTAALLLIEYVDGSSYQPAVPDPAQRVDAIVPDDPVGSVHGDLRSGNTLWRGGELAAVIDWDCAGLGAAGVDLGSVRCDAAMCCGLEAADHVLVGWQREAGRPAELLAYWDAVAALSTPSDIDWFAEAIAGVTGRPDLTRELLRQRRDAFLADALGRLR